MAPSLKLIGFVLDGLGFPCRIVHQRRDFDHVAVRYLRLMRLLRLAPAAIEQSLRSSHAGSIWRFRLLHDLSECPDGGSRVRSSQRSDIGWSFGHLVLLSRRHCSAARCLWEQPGAAILQNDLHEKNENLNKNPNLPALSHQQFRPSLTSAFIARLSTQSCPRLI